MMTRNDVMSRRDFFKTAGAAGLGSIVAPISSPAGANESSGSVQQAPTRTFGTSGERVPILALGGMFDLESNQILLRQAMKMGVSCWDTSAYYPPASEKGIGKYLAKYPEDRKKIFLITKSPLSDPSGWDFHLEQSLERMNTTYVDLFLIHMISDITKLEPFNRTRTWVEKKKASGKFKLFGFSAHENMADCMTDGAKLGWIDGMMVTYNYRILFTREMRMAVNACAKAGIGLIAMKTQAAAALGDSGFESPTALQLTDQFVRKGLTPEQAKLKIVWENPKIASICSQITNLTLLKANVAAAVDKATLSHNEKILLQQAAAETRTQYCAGCSRICLSAVGGKVPIPDLMRYLMYSRCYNDHNSARALFRQIPDDIRARLTRVDYSESERRCPQHLAIGSLMRRVSEELA